MYGLCLPGVMSASWWGGGLRYSNCCFSVIRKTSHYSSRNICRCPRCLLLLSVSSFYICSAYSPCLFSLESSYNLSFWRFFYCFLINFYLYWVDFQVSAQLFVSRFNRFVFAAFAPYVIISFSGFVYASLGP